MSRKAVVHISLNRRAVPKIIAYHFHSHVNIYIHMPTPRVSQTYALYSLQYKVRTPPPTPPSFEKPKDPFAIDLHFSRQATSLTALLVAH